MPDQGRVAVTEVHDMDSVRAVVGLLESVWGRNDEGVPMPSEMVRAVAHAGGLVSAAYDGGGTLVGAAVLGRDVPGAAYSFIAASRPGLADRGIGFRLKQHQRLWALARDISTISWTFDPLVGRNARFNLTKLGATVREYEVAFYGVMTDRLNGADEADRLVARWELTTLRAAAAAEGKTVEPPPPDRATARADGPDGEPAYAAIEDQRWVRVPPDVVALRRADPITAGQWRGTTREWIGGALADGFVADGVTRDGWYHLRREGGGPR